jgi:glyoxalase family protein
MLIAGRGRQFLTWFHNNEGDPMMTTIAGLHHVTAIAIDPQANIEFCTKVLGLRLIKETVNFDDPSTYHFYYGDTAGRPGTILTFFPIVMSARGHRGTGMVDTTTFAVPENSLERWMTRLTEYEVEFDGPFERFSHQTIAFRDPNGLALELAALGAPGTADAPDAIRGFDAVTLCVEAPERTVRLLTETFGYRQIAETSDRIRFRAAGEAETAIGTAVDVQCQPEAQRHQRGGGTVHHVAFRSRCDEEQKTWREQILSLGFNVTPVLDRRYFRSPQRFPRAGSQGYPSPAAEQVPTARRRSTSVRRSPRVSHVATGFKPCPERAGS